MMASLSALFGAATGAFSLRWLIYPATALLSLVGGHVMFENYKGRLRDEGDRRCTARWESEIRDEERNKAAQATASMRGILEGERRVIGELHNDLDAIKTENELMRSQLDPTVDDKCLSGGVLERLGGNAKPEPVGAGAAESGAAASAANAREVLKKRPRDKKQSGGGSDARKKGG